MQIIKLSAIGSTNDFLKEMATKGEAENQTLVTAESQFAGRGQMGAKWESEVGKNLIMSFLIQDVLANATQIYALNIAVSTSVIFVLKKYNLPELSIKWPNDILSGNKKLGGILIENSFKPSGEIDSVIGIGLNVNQSNFENLPKASSVKNVLNSEIDVDVLANEIALQIIENTTDFEIKTEILQKFYKDLLFRKDIPTAFETRDGNRFMAIIRDVSVDGKLIVELDDGDFKQFALKEIQMLY